jgi:hypothetical protein
MKAQMQERTKRSIAEKANMQAGMMNQPGVKGGLNGR